MLPFGQVELLPPAPYSDLRDSHASRPANRELLRLAAQSPEHFIGKNVVLENGTMVGPVLAVRRRLQDRELYLIVNATRFFRSPTNYAIPARDLRSISDDRLIIGEYTGMHLRGLEYYPEDYADLGERQRRPAAP